jgi:hypothetical protein
MYLISDGFSVGSTLSIIATVPDTSGVANEVPLALVVERQAPNLTPSELARRLAVSEK